MRKLAPLLILILLVCAASSVAQTFTAQFHCSNFVSLPVTITRARLTPYLPFIDYTNAILVDTPIVGQTDTNGVVTFTNLFSGYTYIFELDTPFKNIYRTNGFPLGVTGTVNGENYIGIWLPGQTIFAYLSTNLVTQGFLTTNSILAGTNVTIQTNNGTLTINSSGSGGGNGTNFQTIFSGISLSSNAIFDLQPTTNTLLTLGADSAITNAPNNLNVTLGTVTAALNGNATTATTAGSFTGVLAGAVVGTQNNTAIALNPDITNSYQHGGTASNITLVSGQTIPTNTFFSAFAFSGTNGQVLISGPTGCFGPQPGAPNGIGIGWSMSDPEGVQYEITYVFPSHPNTAWLKIPLQKNYTSVTGWLMSGPGWQYGDDNGNLQGAVTGGGETFAPIWEGNTLTLVDADNPSNSWNVSQLFQWGGLASEAYSLNFSVVGTQHSALSIGTRAPNNAFHIYNDTGNLGMAGGLTNFASGTLALLGPVQMPNYSTGLAAFDGSGLISSTTAPTISGANITGIPVSSVVGALPGSDFIMHTNDYGQNLTLSNNASGINLLIQFGAGQLFGMVGSNYTTGGFVGITSNALFISSISNATTNILPGFKDSNTVAATTSQNVASPSIELAGTTWNTADSGGTAEPFNWGMEAVGIKAGVNSSILYLYNGTNNSGTNYVFSLDSSGNIIFTGTESGNGSGITSLNATQLTSGTVPVARLPLGTTSTVGAVSVDNTTIAVNGSGQISLIGGGGGGYPTNAIGATTNLFGVANFTNVASTAGVWINPTNGGINMTGALKVGGAITGGGNISGTTFVGGSLDLTGGGFITVPSANVFEFYNSTASAPPTIQWGPSTTWPTFTFTDSGGLSSLVASSPGGNSFVLQAQHYGGNGSAPTVVTNSGAGGGVGTVTLDANATDAACTVTLNTGSATTPAANATAFTITFNKAYATAPHVIFCPGNANAASLNGVTMVFAPAASTTTATLTTGPTGLAATTTYIWNMYFVQ